MEGGVIVVNENLRGIVVTAIVVTHDPALQDDLFVVTRSTFPPVGGASPPGTALPAQSQLGPAHRLPSRSSQSSEARFGPSQTGPNHPRPAQMGWLGGGIPSNEFENFEIPISCILKDIGPICKFFKT